MHVVGNQIELSLQEFLGWLSKNCDENPRMRNIFKSKSPPKQPYGKWSVCGENGKGSRMNFGLPH